jgi:hypothetical protein
MDMLRTIHTHTETVVSAVSTNKTTSVQISPTPSSECLCQTVVLCNTTHTPSVDTDTQPKAPSEQTHTRPVRIKRQGKPDFSNNYVSSSLDQFVYDLMVVDSDGHDPDGHDVHATDPDGHIVHIVGKQYNWREGCNFYTVDYPNGPYACDYLVDLPESLLRPVHVCTNTDEVDEGQAAS